MGPNQREIKRPLRVLKPAEKIGNFHMTCRHFGRDRTIQTKVTELVQLNQWGPYSYSRDELVKLLDEVLAAVSSGE